MTYYYSFFPPPQRLDILAHLSVVLHAVMADIVAYIRHVLHPVGLRVREAGSAGEMWVALPARIGVTESSYDHMVLYSGGVRLHQVGSKVVSSFLRL